MVRKVWNRSRVETPGTHPLALVASSHGVCFKSLQPGPLTLHDEQGCNSLLVDLLLRLYETHPVQTEVCSYETLLRAHPELSPAAQAVRSVSLMKGPRSRAHPVCGSATLCSVFWYHLLLPARLRDLADADC